ncbi:MAG TPA: hypothetical protein VNN77_03760 [candidate division Zixibacteria bacterium]|nr:hypothetical protein [candidate division Zixibacteria bacterium]
MGRNRILLPSVAETIFLSIFVFLSLGYGAGLLGDGDTGYHIRAGEFILARRTVPKADIFSFWEPPLPWMAHEWLSEVIMAIVHAATGLTGMVVMFSFVLALTFALLYKMLREHRTDALLALVVTYLAAVSSALHWLARPHVFSLLLTVVWYRLLNRFQYGGRGRLGLLPLVALLWVNLHGGFILGLVLLGIYAACNVVAAATDPLDSQSHWIRAGKLSVCLLACIAVSVVNPRGWDMLIFPFQLTSNRFILDHISEFLSPNFHRPLPFKYLLMLCVALLAWTKTRLDWIELALILIFTYMALFSARYIPLWAIVTAPILCRLARRTIAELPPRLGAFWQTRAGNLERIEQRTRSYVWSGAGLAVVATLVATGAFKVDFDAKRFPAEAVEFLRREHIPGRMFNDDEYGDYLIYKAWPQYRVSFDGRSDMYGEKMGREYLKMVQVLPGWEKTAEDYGIGWVFVPTRSSLAAVLAAREDWRPIYSDRVATIFVRNNETYRALIQKYPAVKVQFPEAENST